MPDIKDLPLQAQCSAPSCRRRMTIPISDVYFVISPSKGGGTHKDAGWDCPKCGHENVTPASFLRRGVLATLGTRESVLAATAPEPIPAPVAEVAASAIPEAPVAVVVHERAEQRERHDATVTVTIDLDKVDRQPEADKGSEPKTLDAAPAHVWKLGREAHFALVAALGRAVADPSADVMVLGRDEDGMLDDFGSEDEDLQIDRFYEWLAECRAELAIIGGENADGSLWKVIVHPKAGVTVIGL